MSTIEAAFTQCDLDELKANAEAVVQGLEHVEAIDSSLTDQVGASRSVGLDELRNTLLELRKVLATNLQLRDPSTVVEGADGSPSDQASTAESGQTAARAPGEIRSREDVVAALDRICQYYNRYEPSSPLPLLLRRAKRLASKSFLEIVKDLTPDAVSQIERLSGVSEDGESD